MKLSRLIKELQEVENKYGDMQVYAFGYKISSPHVYTSGEDEKFIDFSRA